MRSNRIASDEIKDQAGQIFWRNFSKGFFKGEAEFKKAISAFMKEHNINAEVEIEDIWISFGNEWARILEKGRKQVELAIDNNYFRKTSSSFRTPEIGDIVISKTHYNGTYNWFFEVVGKSGMSTLILQHIDSTPVSEETVYGAGSEIPNPKKKLEPPFKARWNGDSVKVPYGKFAKLWDGSPVSYLRMD